MYKQPSRNVSSGQIINKMKDLSNAATVEVEAESEGQRVDNFLLRLCKGVPRSHIYRILRSGEVRVNSRRVDATYRLRPGDRVRIPPMRLARRTERIAQPLDRETSGLLILAKKRSALTARHAALREGRVKKEYLALVKGGWRNDKQHVSHPLKKFLTGSGERRVSVHREGRESQTVFRRKRGLRDFTLLSAELLTGRTHQIRVHLTHLGFPIAGDDKYGDFELNRALAKQGLRRMFLHAGELEFAHPLSGEALKLHAPLPQDLSRFLDSLGG